MIIYQGIQFVYAHVVQFVQSVGTWFTQIQWGEVVEMYPLQFQAPISALIVILLAMSCIGFCKKMSFLLG